MHPGGTAHLSHTADGFFHLFGRHQHQIGQLVDNHYNGGHFLHALGLGGQGVVLLQLTHAHLGEGAVALHHLSDRPLQGSGRLFGVGDHGNQQMRDAVVDTQLYHFRVHHDETDLFGAGFIKEGNNQRVGTHRLTGASGTSDKQVRKLSNVPYDGLSADVLTYGKGYLRFAASEGLGGDDRVNGHGRNHLVGHFDAYNRNLVRNGCDTHAGGTQSQGNVVG